MKKKISLLTVLFILLAGFVSAQNIGLVFAGGGAKGAYEIGVWKALDEYGLSERVTAVSGTSVGAFNAALFVNKTQQEAEKLWLNEIGYIEVFTPDLNKIGAGKNYVASFADEVASIYRENRNKVDVKALEDLSKDDIPDDDGGLGIDETAIKKEKGIVYRALDTAIAKLKPVLAEIGAVTFTTGSAAKAIGVDIGKSLWNYIGTDRSAKGMFSRSELKKIIEENITLKKTNNSKINVYATTIRKRRLLAKALALSPEQIIGERQLPDVASTVLSLMPDEYTHTFKLNDQTSMEHISQILLASSAIPLAFDTVKISGDAIALNGKKIGKDFEYIDGGFELVGGNNVPVKPVADEKKVDTIIVVYLQSEEEIKSRIQESDVRKKNLIEIIPSKPLGNLIGGTLNFKQNQIRDLIDLGYEDACKVFSQYYRR